MIKILLVGSGGFIGSVSRYLIGEWVARASNSHWFPFGTLAVNILGCLLIGLLSGLAETKHVLPGEVRLFLVVGLLGGFTTFSSFGHETMHLLRSTQVFAAGINILLQVVIGLGAAWLGYVFAKSF